MSNVLPTWRPPKPTITRPSAERVNELQPQKQTITVAGYGEIVPLVYGRAEVAGPVIAGPIDKVNGTIVYYAIALSHGTINKIISANVGSDKHTVNVTPTAAGAAHTITGDGYTYECMFYNGNQTTHDAMLAGQLTNYSDVFAGVSYVRIKMSGVNASWGGIDFEIEGKKVFDPRSNTTVYSENPALHLNDFVSNPVWGLGRQVIGVERAANECDRILAYGPKSRTGHTINTSASESGNLELLAMYAEVLFGFSGDAVIIVPDAAVDESEIIDIPIKQIWNGSVRPSSKSAENIPSSITITFNTKDTDGLAGSPAYVSIEQTSASDPVVNSALTLIGVYRREEAQRRANQRLAQLRTPGRVSFQMFDSGIYFKAGDVVRMPDIMGLGGSLFRLVSDPTMVRAGAYQLDGEVCEKSVYTTPLGTQEIPKGSVSFRMDQTTPNGLEQLSELGLLVGGVNETPLTLGNDDVPIPPTTQTTVGGFHVATKLMSGRIIDFSTGEQVSRGDLWYGAGQGPNHMHTIASRVGSIGAGLWDTTRLRALRAVESTIAPVGTVWLHRDDIETIGQARVIAAGLLRSINTQPLGFVGKAALNLGTAPAHIHDGRAKRQGFNTRWDGIAVSNPNGGADGAHSHETSFISNAPLLKEASFCLYRTLNTQAIIPEGAVLGFYDSGPAPDGWVLCDGSNGSINLVGAFIGFDSDQEGASSIGNVTVTDVEIEVDGAHTHEGSHRVGYQPITGNRNWTSAVWHDEEDGLHTHEIEWQGGNPFPITVTPRYTKLRFIQYIGE